MQKLATELGIADLPEVEREVLVEGFSEIVLKAATAAVLEKLSEAKQEEFATLAEAGDPVALTTFLDREVPGHEALAGAAVREEITTFKKSVLA